MGWEDRPLFQIFNPDQPSAGSLYKNMKEWSFSSLLACFRLVVTTIPSLAIVSSSLGIQARLKIRDIKPRGLSNYCILDTWTFPSQTAIVGIAGLQLVHYTNKAHPFIKYIIYNIQITITINILLIIEAIYECIRKYKLLNKYDKI